MASGPSKRGSLRCVTSVKHTPDFKDLVWKKKKNIKYLTDDFYMDHTEMIAF